MGMYDTVIIDKSVIEKHFKEGLLCYSCNNQPDLGGWQTKDMGCCLDTYLLSLDEKGDTRLYFLDPPDKKYFREYTPEEIEEHNAKLNDKFVFMRWVTGDGEYSREGWLPENRHKRSLGELPHQYCSFYITCRECKYPAGWVELKVKFTDGVAVSFERVIER